MPLSMQTLLKLRVAICKQLNAAPYLGGVHSISLGHNYEKRPCQPYAALVNHSAVNSFIDLGEFGAMKTLSGRIAPRCDKHQFCDKMTVST